MIKAMKILRISIVFITLIAILPLQIQPKLNAKEKVGTLNNFWNGEAEWKFRNALTLGNTGWSYGYMDGNHIEVVDGVWYMFSRKVLWGVKPSYCNINENLTIEVRKSTDQGFTWSQPVNLLENTPGTAWECIATDGDVYFDRETNTWHLLFQCVSRQSVWNGCYVKRQNYDPMGPFTQSTVNPVITPGSLFSKICDTPADDCTKLSEDSWLGKIYDEGTFAFVNQKINGFYYVSFHGYDGVKGYRGLGKTKDFVNWIVGDSLKGVPNDAIFDKYDSDLWSENWQGGSIGSGAADIVHEDGKYYMIIEAADMNLACTENQQWDWGMLRTNSLTSTKWNQLPQGNPFLYSSKTMDANGNNGGCRPGYATLTRDDLTGKYYLSVAIDFPNHQDLGVYIYELKLTGNQLKNADMWKCDKSNWKKITNDTNPTIFKVLRYPENSSDYNCYMEVSRTNSSGPITKNGIYQDVDISSLTGAEYIVEFGAKIKVEHGTGKARFAIEVLDENKKVIMSLAPNKLNLPQDVYGSYKDVVGSAKLSTRAKYLRFKIFLESEETFRIDEAYLRFK